MYNGCYVNFEQDYEAFSHLVWYETGNIRITGIVLLMYNYCLRFDLWETRRMVETHPG